MRTGASGKAPDPAASSFFKPIADLDESLHPAPAPAAEAPAMPATAKSPLADDEAEPVEMPEPNDQRFCHVCGAELTEDVPFCPACGTRVAE